MSKIIIPEDHQKYHQKEFFDGFGQLLVLKVAYISYNTGTSVLPDIYALALGYCAYISGNALLPML